MNGINLDNYDITEMYQLKAINDLLEKKDIKGIMNLCGYDEETALNSIKFYDQGQQSIIIEQIYNDYLNTKKRKHM